MKWMLFIFVFCFISCKNTSVDSEKIKINYAHNHNEMTSSSTLDDYANQVNAGRISKDTMKGSSTRVAMNSIGKTHVHIEYGSPGTKDRVIWGGVVPYDKVWVTGAHQATSININHPIIISGTIIPKGIYAFFTIPSKDKWTGILNENYEQHLTDQYDSTKDIVRFSIKPNTIDHFVKRLTYSVKNLTETTGVISMEWEKIKLDINFTTVDN